MIGGLEAAVRVLTEMTEPEVTEPKMVAVSLVVAVPLDVAVPEATVLMLPRMTGQMPVVVAGLMAGATRARWSTGSGASTKTKTAN